MPSPAQKEGDGTDVQVQLFCPSPVSFSHVIHPSVSGLQTPHAGERPRIECALKRLMASTSFVSPLRYIDVDAGRNGRHRCARLGRNAATHVLTLGRKARLRY